MTTRIISKARNFKRGDCVWHPDFECGLVASSKFTDAGSEVVSVIFTEGAGNPFLRVMEVNYTDLKTCHDCSRANMSVVDYVAQALEIERVEQPASSANTIQPTPQQYAESRIERELARLRLLYVHDHPFFFGETVPKLGYIQSFRPDFLVCSHGWLGIIEVDGPSHLNEEVKEKDRIKDEFFRQRGLSVIHRAWWETCKDHPVRVVQDFLAKMEHEREQLVRVRSVSDQ